MIVRGKVLGAALEQKIGVVPYQFRGEFPDVEFRDPNDSTWKEIKAYLSPEELQGLLQERTDTEFKKAVHAERDRLVAAGGLVPLTGIEGGIPIDGSGETQRLIAEKSNIALARLQSGDTTTEPFWGTDNVVHDLTPEQFIELAEIASAFKTRIFQRALAIKAMDPRPASVSDPELWQ